MELVVTSCSTHGDIQSDW